MEPEKPIYTTFDGGLRLPVGYRFRPTDEELVVSYLKKKILELPLPASVIPEVDVLRAEPYDLPGNPEEKRYFFSIRKDDALTFRRKRVAFAGSGYWKSTRKYKQIMDSKTNQTVGVRRTLIFCEAKSSRNTRTRWVMHELSLVGSGIPTTDPCMVTMRKNMGDWVVYRIFQKKIRPKRNGVRGQHSEDKMQQILEEIKPCVIDFTQEHNNGDEGPPPPSPPSFSEATISEFRLVK